MASSKCTCLLNPAITINFCFIAPCSHIYITGTYPSCLELIGTGLSESSLPYHEDPDVILVIKNRMYTYTPFRCSQRRLQLEKQLALAPYNQHGLLALLNRSGESNLSPAEVLQGLRAPARPIRQYSPCSRGFTATLISDLEKHINTVALSGNFDEGGAIFRLCRM
jgi:hypothetical protein